MSDANDPQVPEPVLLHHYNDDLADEAQGAIDSMIAREARELVRSPDPTVRAAVVYQLAPHEVPFFLGDPDPGVRLAAVRVCAAFPLLRVLLTDLKVQRRDPFEEVRLAVVGLLAADADAVRAHLPTWSTEAVIASPLFDDEDPLTSPDHPRLRVLPSGSARERATSASWARRDILDTPVADFEPSPRDEQGTLRKTVTRVHDANRQSFSPPDAEIRVEYGEDDGFERRRNPPGPHAPAEGAWDFDPPEADAQPQDTEPPKEAP